MRYLVFIKQVPDMDEVEFDYEEGRIDRSSAAMEPNPFDLNALEEAVRYKENIGGEVIAVSMGPRQAESTVKEALARGADRGILLCGREFAGSDTWATSLALGHAARKLGQPNVIFCGEKTVDGDTGQVGPEIAEFLNIPHASFVSEIKNRDENSLQASSDVWSSTYTKELSLPGLVTVTKDINKPRLPYFRDKRRAREADVEIWNNDDISLEESRLGIKGSPTYVSETEVPPPQKREAKIFREGPKESVEKLFQATNLKREGSS